MRVLRCMQLYPDCSQVHCQRNFSLDGGRVQSLRGLRRCCAECGRRCFFTRTGDDSPFQITITSEGSDSFRITRFETTLGLGFCCGKYAGANLIECYALQLI